MVNFLRYCCTSCVICCTFWIFWQAEAKTISQAVGSTVILNCSNNSVKNFTMATWTMNGNNLFSFSKRGNKSAFDKGVDLNLKMSESQSQMFALIIEDAKKLHEGNYTCEMTADFGVSSEQWELIITEANNSIEALKIPVIAGVPSVCFLLLVSVLVILTIRKKRARNRSPTAIRPQPDLLINPGGCKTQKNRTLLALLTSVWPEINKKKSSKFISATRSKSKWKIFMKTTWKFSAARVAIATPDASV